MKIVSQWLRKSREDRKEIRERDDLVAWDLKSDRPIYTQLVEEIELRIISGRYEAGEKLASVRDLAAEAAVNPNTMQRALAELEQRGLVYSQRTSGRFITEDKEMIQRAKELYAWEQMAMFLEKMKQLGFSKEDTIAFFENKVKELK